MVSSFRPDELSARFAATAGSAAQAPSKDSLLPLLQLPEEMNAPVVPASRPLPPSGRALTDRPEPAAVKKPPVIPKRLSPDLLAKIGGQLQPKPAASAFELDADSGEPSPIPAAAAPAKSEAAAKAAKLEQISGMALAGTVIKSELAKVSDRVATAFAGLFGGLGVIVGTLIGFTGKAISLAIAFVPVLAAKIGGEIADAISKSRYGVSDDAAKRWVAGAAVATNIGLPFEYALSKAGAFVVTGAALLLEKAGVMGKDNPMINSLKSTLNTMAGPESYSAWLLEKNAAPGKIAKVDEAKARIAAEKLEAARPKASERSAELAAAPKVSEAREKEIAEEAERSMAEVRAHESFVNYNLPESTAKALLGNSPVGSWILCNDEMGKPVIYKVLEDKKTQEISVAKINIAMRSLVDHYRGAKAPMSLARLLPSAKPGPKPEAAKPAEAAAAAPQPHVPKKPTAHVAPPPKPTPPPGVAVTMKRAEERGQQLRDALAASKAGAPAVAPAAAAAPKPAAAPAKSEAEIRARLRALEAEAARRAAAAKPAGAASAKPKIERPPLPPLPATPPKPALLPVPSQKGVSAQPTGPTAAARSKAPALPPVPSQAKPTGPTIAAPKTGTTQPSAARSKRLPTGPSPMQTRSKTAAQRPPIKPKDAK